MIRVFAAYLSDLPDSTAMESALPASWRTAWAAQHPHMPEGRAKQASLGALYLLSEELSDATLSYTDRGRPMLTGGVWISISHTEDAVFSVSSTACPVGIDGERSNKALPRADAFAERWLTERERAMLDGNPTAFLRVWTRKEALLKLNGTGLGGLAHADTVTALESGRVTFCELSLCGAQVSLCVEGSICPELCVVEWRNQPSMKQHESLEIRVPEEVRALLARMEEQGEEAYAVGGCVRDALLGRMANDWDLTTSATPERMKEIFSDHRTVENGIKHGTLTVLRSGVPYEITTYRHDGVYLDNRHPSEVTFSKNIEDDLGRRDFTVNAMAYHPTRGLCDLYGGRKDLDRRIIRCVGEPSRRFREDGLRILRAIRFASVLDFTLEEQTERAVFAHKELLSGIAAERIREEFCKLLLGKGAVRVLRRYTSVIGVFLPEFEACMGFLQNSKYHCYDVGEHILHALDETEPELILRLAVLLHDIGKPLCYTEDELGGHFKGHGEVGTEMTRAILTRLRFDKKTIERVTTLVKYHDRDFPAEERPIKRLMQKMSDEDIQILMRVKRADRLAHAEGYNALPDSLEEIPRMVKRLRDAQVCLSLSTLAVKGDDLIALGIPAGKALGAMLNRLLEAVLEGTLPNERETLLDAVEKFHNKMY